MVHTSDRFRLASLPIRIRVVLAVVAATFALTGCGGVRAGDRLAGPGVGPSLVATPSLASASTGESAAIAQNAPAAVSKGSSTSFGVADLATGSESRVQTSTALALLMVDAGLILIVVARLRSPRRPG